MLVISTTAASLLVFAALLTVASVIAARFLGLAEDVGMIYVSATGITALLMVLVYVIIGG